MIFVSDKKNEAAVSRVSWMFLAQLSVESRNLCVKISLALVVVVVFDHLNVLINMVMLFNDLSLDGFFFVFQVLLSLVFVVLLLFLLD